MSSLQCPTTLILVCHGEEAPGREEAVSLAEQLVGRRVAQVWTGDQAPAVRTGEIAAARLGVSVTTRASLSTLDDEVVTGLREVLGEIADLHPGETVLVVGHGDALRLAVPQLARMDVQPTRVDDGSTIELVLDADDWVCRAWG